MTANDCRDYAGICAFPTCIGVAVADWKIAVSGAIGIVFFLGLSFWLRGAK